MLDAIGEKPWERQALHEVLERVLEHGQFILGEEVSRFESKMRDYLGVRHAVGVSSGTDALWIALLTLGIGPGDEVICPAFTFVATADAIALVGAKPVFVDVYPCCFTLSVEDLLRKWTPQTRAIMVVHLFGQPAQMDRLAAIAAQRGAYLIEDAAQALGTTYGGRKAGTLGTVGCFSFYPTKNLGALGDAGLVVTGDDGLAKKILALRSHGAVGRYRYRWVSGNFRLDALQAAWLESRLPALESKLAARKQNAERYISRFLSSGLAQVYPSVCSTGPTRVATTEEPLLWLPPVCRSGHSWNQFVVRLHPRIDRDWVQQALRKEGIETAVYYPVPLHLQECFQWLQGRPGDCPHSEELAGSSLALPVHAGLGPEEVDYVVETLVRLLRSQQL
ncbi:Pleiotropic regulatory protein [Candidatus Methylacidithermus pantelleriae]|uniref:Pleiotropic regulatory protein n=2 Tax=Candidatus Methylacidithermus pantelleriae TaxID=2744239 RepID=A0A8J2BLS7_9BACT|nr:Pleiotropic regulatory protein [Candidatus Methylacidithermus pantelleriae]